MYRMMCVLLSVLLLCTACAPTPTEDVTAEVMQALVEAINAEDAQALLGLCSEAVRGAEGMEETAQRMLADFTDTIDRFELIGSETTEYITYGDPICQTVAHYDLFSETAHYTALLSVWHTDGEVGYPNTEELGVHTLKIVEDADLAEQYNGQLDQMPDTAGLQYRPSRLYACYTPYKGVFRVVDEEGTVWLTNEDVASARVEWVSNGDTVLAPAVMLELTEEGTEQFAEATRRNLYKTLPIYIGEALVAEPIVEAVIDKGEVILSGGDLLKTYADAEEMAVYFNTYEKG